MRPSAGATGFNLHNLDDWRNETQPNLFENGCDKPKSDNQHRKLGIEPGNIKKCLDLLLPRDSIAFLINHEHLCEDASTKIEDT